MDCVRVLNKGTTSSVASFLVLGGGGGKTPKKCNSYARASASETYIFSGLKIHLHIQSMQFPFITYGMALYRQYNDKILTLRKIYEYMRASLENFRIFTI